MEQEHQQVHLKKVENAAENRSNGAIIPHQPNEGLPSHSPEGGVVVMSRAIVRSSNSNSNGSDNRSRKSSPLPLNTEVILAAGGGRTAVSVSVPWNSVTLPSPYDRAGGGGGVVVVDSSSRRRRQKEGLPTVEEEKNSHTSGSNTPNNDTKLRNLSSLIIVGMSANSDSESKRLAKEAGMDYFLEKPFTMDDFNVILQRMYISQHPDDFLDDEDFPSPDSPAVTLLADLQDNAVVGFTTQAISLDYCSPSPAPAAAVTAAGSPTPIRSYGDGGHTRR
jgi:CheY-like chemotaxis protein